MFAVGNALGDGVVIRDGLLTSMTPEDQDGRWKWLRFSAAASPGNSGGPLLDAQGRVVGVVVARSPGENLNFALPIERVTGAKDGVAAYDVRESFELPMLMDTQVSVLKGAFELPLPFAEFATRMRDVQLRYFRTERDRLLNDKAGELFPKGAASKLLAVSERPDRPALVVQEDDHTWVTREGDPAENADLPGEGSVNVHIANGVGLFTLVRPDSAHDDAFYSDSRAFMDTLLKGLKLTRDVGSQSIRITSAGVASRDALFADKFGRKWQTRLWPLGYLDSVVLIAALPVPDGYVGMIRFANSAQVETEIEKLQMLTAYFQTPFSGSLEQWRAYLARKPLRASAFDAVKLHYEEATGLRYESPRLRASIPPDLLRLGADSTVALDMDYLLDGAKLAWDVGALTVTKDLDGETYIAAYRQPKPATDAGRELLQRWDRMMKRDAEFDGTLARDENYKAISVRSSLGRTMTTQNRPDPTSAVLYEVVYRTNDRLLPREMEQRRSKVMQGLTILEH